jgi:hypothetical protein
MASLLSPCRPHVCPFSAGPGQAVRAPRGVAAHALAANQVGVHSMVFVGGWSREEAVRAIGGAQRAGYDLIERAPSPFPLALVLKVLVSSPLRKLASRAPACRL